MDADNSGDINWQEFKTCWLALWDSWDYRQLKKVFGFADENADGVLSYDEARAEYTSQNNFSHKFNAVDKDGDNALSLNEWEANLLWIPDHSTPAVVRERFGYYDENSDGKIQRDELYNVIRANQQRWSRFDRLWNQIDVNGDAYTNLDEALEGLRVMMNNPNLSQAEAQALLNKYDKNKDGRVHKIEFWAAESHFWDHNRDDEFKDYSWNQHKFNSGWFMYDVNRDFEITYDELRSMREIIESEEKT